MGLIRVLLAAAVVLGHAPGWAGYDPQTSFVRPLPGYFAVQAFFVISGFYMELLRKKYAAAPIWIFYSNRYSRLIVSYWIVLAATALLIVLIPGTPSPPADFLARPTPDSASKWAMLVFSNVTMFGQSLLTFVFGLNSNALLIPQGWSLELELWFYLLVPLLWRASDRTLWAVVIASLAIRLLFVASPLPFWPWQQRFFPAEIMFFVLGMLSFRRSSEILTLVRSRRACLLLLSALIIFAGWLYPVVFPWSALPESEAIWPSSLLIGAIFYITLPPIFALTSRSRIDRFVGEFSYPIYLVHITLWFFQPSMLLFLCFVASAPLVLFVERPLETWRNRRLRDNATKPSRISKNRSEHDVRPAL
jgi:peptidoglycan/LPS O-acetylase OafA/YrhL